MDYETSAGGIIIGSKNELLHVLLLKDKNNNWTFPKGLIEQGEDPQKTAQREIAEEVGVKHLILVSALSPISFFYRWEGRLKHKTVQYYLFQGKGTEIPTPQTDEGILEVRWMPFAEAEKQIGYKKTNGKLLKEVKAKLAKLNPKRHAELVSG